MKNRRNRRKFRNFTYYSDWLLNDTLHLKVVDDDPQLRVVGWLLCQRPIPKKHISIAAVLLSSSPPPQIFLILTAAAAKQHFSEIFKTKNTTSVSVCVCAWKGGLVFLLPLHFSHRTREIWMVTTTTSFNNVLE